MKLSDEFILREVAGTYIVMPYGEKSVDFNSMITLNETGAFIWKKLEQNLPRSELVLALVSEYEVTEEQASEDVCRFFSKLKDAHMLD
ncbi:PqqD family protein [Ethanoligenens harbinense]|uniref:PqqD family protein n=1 Tax=Ethanoligenens harbinense (strain DSM 18485 / JCM 12961 / CGMCC 1.5033 / YUAN-3) TaxID=663278 RepID=E6U3E1_ETHHY|nr:PqqD family protein [Ethanoligenens harbinense]ADU26433.1 hypothetical protein Ethha_0866 [Ethanoligenens harbinense YUAN-3]AVQ95554.1 PqqD family protein [Ethanoligenens harbinense YUAN-3]AYF38218.1 PqqD family protein [Ethanoligenens harbinense]AYF40963.1 PqqD family protein [Ethanoligenens harbinense]QCN91796.1 PqqD family protein [Ethanoligenens harbinense]